MLKLKWPNNDTIKIINIYTSVKDYKQLTFWAKVEMKQ